MKALCINVQPIKALYSKYEQVIQYPEIGTVYDVIAYTQYVGKKREFIAYRLAGIKNKKVKIMGRELHFPKSWFITDDNPSFDKIVEYYKRFH